MPQVSNDTFRFYHPKDLSEGSDSNYRSDYRRDYARVLHSSSFRRLGNKTQLFPGDEIDFFRNRLTHSLEVAQIAKSIAIKIKAEHPEVDVEPDVCEIAGLVHDLGHPPFGHNGERSLDDCMKEYGGFEGNAQTLRIITRLEKTERNTNHQQYLGNDCRIGLNLTARTIASALKYDEMIPESRRSEVELVKGYYASEKPLIDKIKEQLCIDGVKGKIKTIDCAIMDLADDIAYSTYDVEDAFKAGFLTPVDMMSVNDNVLQQIVDKLNKDEIAIDVNEARQLLIELFSEVWESELNEQQRLSGKRKDYTERTLENFLKIFQYSKVMASDGFSRTSFTSYLVNRFITGVTVEPDKETPLLSKVTFDSDTLKLVNLLKHFSFVSLINSSMLKVAENRGYDIIQNLFEKIKKDDGYRLLPEDFQILFKLDNSVLNQRRVICDFISGMTDRYALEFYGRLFSENPQTIFKPI